MMHTDDDDHGHDQHIPERGTCYTCEEQNVEIAAGVLGTVGNECWECYWERIDDPNNAYDRG